MALSLVGAVIRPFGLPEALFGLPAAAILIVSGIEPWSAARAATRQLGPTLAFLALILVFGHLCAEAGVFDYLGAVAARASGARPTRLLAIVVGLAALVTAALTLDATVVLLTPVVLRSAARLRVAATPHSYACVELANAGSLLLPISNLTNLLAFSASGLSFGRFAAVMTLPWLLACLLDWGSLRLAFPADLRRPGDQPPYPPEPPVFALVVLAATIAGFVLTTALGTAPAWAALAGCLVLGGRQLLRRQVGPAGLVRSTSPGFCAFVLCLAVLVAGVLDRGGDRLLRHLIPTGTGLLAMLALALLAGALANLVNNLPTTLALLPLVAGSPLAVLVVLVGVNLGPNATFPGSLATLLWRRILPESERPRALEFHTLGLLSTPVLIVAVSTALWLVAGPLSLR